MHNNHEIDMWRKIIIVTGGVKKMRMTDFAKEITGNMKFVSYLIQLELENKEPKYIRVFDETGTDLEIDIEDAAFSNKKRKGLEEGKSYFLLKGVNYSINRGLTTKGLLDIYFDDLDEDNIFQSPVLLNRSTGAYYKVIGLGRDMHHNIAFWVKKVN